MRAVSDDARALIESLASDRGGGVEIRWVADLMYDGDRRLQDLAIEAPKLSWDASRFVVADGSIRVVWADPFGGSMLPTQIGDWFSPFGGELQIDVIVSAGQFSERIPQGRFIIDQVPDAEDRRMLFEGRLINPGQVFTLGLADRSAKVKRDEFRFPTRPTTLSAWQEIQSITGFPIIRSTPDAMVSPTTAYEGAKDAIVNKLFDLMEAWPHLTPDGTLTAMPKAWGPPVDRIRGVVSAPISMSADTTYNVVVVEGKDPNGDPIYAAVEVQDGFLRVRNADGGGSPFGQKVHRYASEFLTSYPECLTYARNLLDRVSRLRGVVRQVVEPFNPLREVGDVLEFDGGVVRIRSITHDGPQTSLVVEVPDM